MSGVYLGLCCDGCIARGEGCYLSAVMGFGVAEELMGCDYGRKAVGMHENWTA